MATTRTIAQRYEARRTERTELHVPLQALRYALGLTIDDVIDRIDDATGKRPSRGTISAIEHGKRGASAGMIHALEIAYGLPEGSITSDYQPRATARETAA